MFNHYFHTANLSVYTAPQRQWVLAHPAVEKMCSGKWFSNADGQAMMAYKPLGGKTPNGGTQLGVAISQADASISVAWCAEQMKDDTACSLQFVGVAHNNGHCWCAKEGGDCKSNFEINKYFLAGGHFFKLQTPGENTCQFTYITIIFAA